MITFVCWKWGRPGYARVFEPEYVRVLRAMIARNYKQPHRFVCITDSPYGLAGIDTIPLPATFDGVASPHGDRFPSCYRRLWNFSAEAAKFLGPKIMALDIDVVITGDLAPLVDRSETFVGWTDTRATWTRKIAGGVYLLRTGEHTEVWDRFHSTESPRLASVAGHTGSDQGWMSYLLYPPPGHFGAKDGVVSIKWLTPGKPLPLGTKIVSTPGDLKPWHSELQRRFPWIARYWHA